MTPQYKKLPDSPGVYLMKNKAGKLLYIGKAGNLKRRVSSYFLRPHDYRIQKLVSEIAKIEYRKTETALEALILESALIKRLQPPYNILEKDDKSFLYVEITREKFPRVLLIRGKQRSLNTRGRLYGPFTSASSIREALKILRRIFPYSVHAPEQLPSVRACFDCQLGLCPGICIGMMTPTEYGKTIKRLILFFEGKKKRIIASLTKEMRGESKKLEFEKAEVLKRQIFALKHIQDVALISDDSLVASGQSLVAKDFRIEGYDISNISGASAVGSMVVFEENKPNKNEYRKFRIRNFDEPNDVGMLGEMIERRLHHPEWRFPGIMLIDGGKPQVNAVRRILETAKIAIPVVGIAKGPTRKKNEFVGTKDFWGHYTAEEREHLKKTLIRVRDEAHRFAITYHKKIRKREFLPERVEN